MLYCFVYESFIHQVKLIECNIYNKDIITNVIYQYIIFKLLLNIIVEDFVIYMQKPNKYKHSYFVYHMIFHILILENIIFQAQNLYYINKKLTYKFYIYIN